MLYKYIEINAPYKYKIINCTTHAEHTNGSKTSRWIFFYYRITQSLLRIV